MNSIPEKTKETTDDFSSAFAQAVDIALLEPPVEFKRFPAKVLPKALKKLLQWVKRNLSHYPRAGSPRKTAKIPIFQETACTRHGIDRLNFEACQTAEQKVAYHVFKRLDEAINFYQSDLILEARNRLLEVFQAVSSPNEQSLKSPTKYGLYVVERGKEIFLEDDVSCSIKHGTILLDSSNSGAQFYASLLNVVGAFAMVISEFQMALPIFSKLIDWHKKSTVTSRTRDLGAAYNNSGCLALVMGELSKAKDHFKNSLEQFEKQRHEDFRNLLNATHIAVKSNISQVHFISRYFGEALQQQGKLVKECKAKEIQELPLQVVFTVLNNQAMFHTTLGNFNMAEQELRWLKSYLFKMNREDCDLLFNFVSLHLSEVLLLRGKSKEAERTFHLETLMSTGFIDLLPILGGLHMNVRIAAFEKMLDVIVRKGEIQVVLRLLEKAVDILERNFGPDHFIVALLMYKQATVLSLIGETSSSFEKFMSTIDILQGIFGMNHPLLLKCYLSVGDLALRLKLNDDSILFCQRAMENIEAIYQVSFIDQLYTAYMEITTNTNTFKRSMMQDDRIEGLVAEHGQVFAILLSRLVVQKKDRLPLRYKAKGKQPLTRKIRRYQSSDFVLMISVKYARDFLLTGQTLLRHGMRKEAVAFFQQAGTYSEAYHLAQGHCSGWVARLYSTLLETPFEKQHGLENNHDLSNYLEELVEVAGITGVAMRALDCDPNLKLVLIFLILLSIELKMSDTAFAAYGLYSKLFQDDENDLFFLNGEVQVYASRVSITCSGKTALQDVLLASAISLDENGAECSLPDKQLFRSLTCKKNVPTNGFLVISTSSVFRDIGELQELERKISYSVQECFQQKCFQTGVEDSANQVIVDLTEKANTRNYLVSGSRIDLLSLCLSEESNTKSSREGVISQISSTTCQKIIISTFADEQTTNFMFSKTVLGIVQNHQCKSGEISFLSAERHDQCLRLTVIQPVKARLTLWHNERCVQQKIQLVKTAAGHDSQDWMLPGRTFSDGEENISCLCKEIDRLSWPDMDQLSRRYQVSCQTDVFYCQNPLDASVVCCEPISMLVPQCPSLRRLSPIFNREQEPSQTLSEGTNGNILENLTSVSEISRLICHLGGDEIEVDDYAILVDPNEAEDCSATSTCSQLHQRRDPSKFQQSPVHPKGDIQGQTLTPRAPQSTKPWEQEEILLSGAENDENILGRSLFEKDRQSRRFLLAELHQNMKKKEVNIESSFLRDDESPLSVVRQEEECVTMDPMTAETRHMTNSLQSLAYSENSSSNLEQPNGTSVANIRSKTFCVADNEKNAYQYETKAGTSDSDNTLERLLIENDITSRSATLAKLQVPKDEQILSEHNIGDENGSSFERDAEKLNSTGNPDDDVEVFDTIKCTDHIGRHTPVAKKADSNNLETVAKDVKESCEIMKAVVNNSSPELGVEDATGVPLGQSNIRFSSLDETQNHRNDFQEVQRMRNTNESEICNVASQIEDGKQITTTKESLTGGIKERNENQRNPLLNKSVFQHPSDLHVTNASQAITPVDGNVLGRPSNENVNRIQSNVKESLFLACDDVVHGPLKRSEMQSDTFSRSEGNDWPFCFSNATSQDSRQSSYHFQPICQTKTTLFRDGDVVPDGYNRKSFVNSNQDVVDAPISEVKLFSKGLSIEELATQEGEIFQNRTSPNGFRTMKGSESASLTRRMIEGPVDYSKTDVNLSDKSKGFGGARPKVLLPSTGRDPITSCRANDSVLSCRKTDTSQSGLDAAFIARHVHDNRRHSPVTLARNYNEAALEVPQKEVYEERYFSTTLCKHLHNGEDMTSKKEFPHCYYTPNGFFQHIPTTDTLEDRTGVHDSSRSLAIHQLTTPKQSESWYFPPVVTNGNSALLQSHGQQRCPNLNYAKQFEDPSDCSLKALFTSYGSRDDYSDIEYYSGMGTSDCGPIQSKTMIEDQQSLAEHSLSSLLGSLQQVMAQNIQLIASNATAVKQAQCELQAVEKIGIQEEARDIRERETVVSVRVDESRSQRESTQANEPTLETESESIATPVQESPRPACSHYQRRCLVRFPCCGKFYPCHRCHNESDCSEDQARAINATHIRCTICYHEQAIDKDSQKCAGCKATMSEYFCGICKHFTSVDKNPFHCEKCGICRIHRDRSFHCDVCNVCLDKRLQGKHKCRPESGHDECCICLEDAFSGCQILPCSHKVHKDCAIAMIQNGVRTCPICRHPLFGQLQNSSQ